MGSNRDEFPPHVKRAIALRAGYRCSMCSAVTAGPSEDSKEAVAVIGHAAHISAAAPGGPRYNPDMTEEERKSIDNAIWLCASHATLVDRDTAKYTIEGLIEIKNAHESRIQYLMLHPDPSEPRVKDLVAFGPRVIAYGEIERVNGSIWTCGIDNFVSGSIHDITDMIENFDTYRSNEKYFLDNSAGEGRLLVSAPEWYMNDNSYHVAFAVAQRFPRSSVHELGGDIAIDVERRGFVLENGSMKLVSGKDALPQKIALNMWKRIGEDYLSPDYGSRISELFAMYSGTQWIDRVLKLELIRLASIPYQDEYLEEEFTPLLCVNRVISISLLSQEVIDDWIPAQLILDVEGTGITELNLDLYIPDSETELDEDNYG